MVSIESVHFIIPVYYRTEGELMTSIRTSYTLKLLKRIYV